ncbi:MAG TPA: SurA N-terminal domain-containing protein, partial [Dongiaceae bacterium]|nr:SurA N-terminal domain-containing protein [Dongiaceae bacterium]
MLISLRSKGASWAIKTLFGLLIISFAWWGIPETFRHLQPQPRAASVGSTKITPDELRHAVDREMRRLQQSLGSQLEPETMRPMLVSQTLDRLIERSLLAVYAHEAGVVAPDDVLQQDIRSDPAFRNTAGQFDPARFYEILRQNDYSEASYLGLLRQDIVNQQIVGGVQAGAATPMTLADVLYRYRNEQRIAETLLVADSSMTSIAQPDDAALEAFHKANADRYQAPEYRGLTIVHIRPEDRVSQVQVTDEELQAEYDAHRGQYNLPERRELEQIVLLDEAGANAAYDKLKQGRTLSDVSQELLKRAPDPVGLGATVPTLSEADLTKLLGADSAKSVFAVPEGQVSAPVKGPLGWHLVHVKKVEPAVAKTLADVRAELTHTVALRLAGDQLIDVANQLEDELGGGATLADGAKKLGLQVQTVASVDSAGKAPDGTDVAGVAGDGQLLSLAFDTGEGEDSPMTDTPNGGYVILHVEQVRPAATRPLAEVRDKVVADWQAAERQKAATTKAQDIAERVQGGEGLDKIAQELGVTVKRSQPFKRDAGDAAA